MKRYEKAGTIGKHDHINLDGEETFRCLLASCKYVRANLKVHWALYYKPGKYKIKNKYLSKNGWQEIFFAQPPTERIRFERWDGDTLQMATCQTADRRRIRFVVATCQAADGQWRRRII